ncbi:hypothetical protein GMORB2_4630 [Geosmithia morbida]|uniref:Uncharacterized protein n=1 Tax=Geosmithia morbida TaxID=1094350 RepID=A0A9P4YP67_9HYPO|nr:uncharacterized protein GMORB2_4630 [Geosmithia morbida]KAF4119500.1 hypothetical protein GMORB2_4630 [Geosmithia morbida]
MIGYKVAPSPLPTVAVDMASARCRTKYRGTTAMDGTDRQHVPKPTHTPCARSTCQYRVLMLVIMKPAVSSTAPAAIRLRQYPMSNSGPMTTATAMKQKVWMDPIHDIADDDESRSMSVS